MKNATFVFKYPENPEESSNRMCQLLIIDLHISLSWLNVKERILKSI